MMNNNESLLVVFHTDVDGSEKCPLCGEPFVRAEDDIEAGDWGEHWAELGGHHYVRSGGMTRYGCPRPPCDGEIHVTI